MLPTAGRYVDGSGMDPRLGAEDDGPPPRGRRDDTDVIPRPAAALTAGRAGAQPCRARGCTEDLAMGTHVGAGGLDIWIEQVGAGPDVLLIGGAGDTVESWQFQLDGLADRYRLTAF